MAEETTQTNTPALEADVEKAEVESRDSSSQAEKDNLSDKGKRAKKPFTKNVRKPRRREKPRAEFDSKIISIRRVTRVVAGGRRFSFSVALVAGDRKGSVGVGLGKAADTSLAIEKAMRRAKKDMITLTLTESSSIPFDVRAKYTSSDVEITPTPGKGLTAGSSARTVLELAGITDVTGKIYSRSKNQINNARAAILALKKVGHKKHKPQKESAAPGREKRGGVKRFSRRAPQK